jgi:hypothetical protein
MKDGLLPSTREKCGLMRFGVFSRPFYGKSERHRTLAADDPFRPHYAPRAWEGALDSLPPALSVAGSYYCFDFESGSIDSSIRLPALRTIRLARIPDRSV